ncbi:hypothetical protein D9613_004492 [Agrocybe pediades]|uniref:DUF6589 domain-containing protein n=1 Tax=Agrocybe pediades TaxID=84607 RepID=A0A8H4QI70_9AGAR|nr:hypothetical protein D9613_004492 [Agrocybe pediades]
MVLDAKIRIPPRTQGSRKARPQGASAVMRSFCLDYVQKETSRELEQLAPELESSTEIDVEKETLLHTTFDSLSEEMKKSTPMLWTLLSTLTSRSHSRKSNKHKNPLKKLFAIYLKFKGISAKGFDTLHALGLTMSHKWTSNTVERISANCMAEVTELIRKHVWLISYDNINIPFRVFSQRLDNQGEFGSGTAATVYVKKNVAPLSKEANKGLREQRAKGLENPLTTNDILDLATRSAPRLQQHTEYHALRILLAASEFNFATYSEKDSEELQPPPPINQLPCGAENRTLQYLLGSVGTPEASYEDHQKLIIEWLRQLGMDNEQERQRLASEIIIAWCGDQLTIDRLRGLYKLHAEDENSFERQDYGVLVFGWFHCLMAFANSLHKQYLGTTQGRGLRQAFTLLEKRGLLKVLTKGPFYHDLHEAIEEIAAAHILEDWLIISGVDKIEELRNYSPKRLKTLSQKLVKNRASTEGLVLMDIKPEEQKDEQLRQVIMWNRDVLQYIALDHAIRSGDVGLMENILPHLFLRFIGGGNGKYANEILELLQGLHREWTPEVSNFVRHHCWVVNSSGKPSKFCAVDQAQEHNIKDIKVTYRSEGPNVKWEYMKKLHPAIYVIRAVSEHVEKEMGTISRGKRHAIPTRDLDVETLRKSYREAGYHIFTRGRSIERKDDKSEDYSEKGIIKLHKPDFLNRWKQQRAFPRATDEIWGDPDLDSSESEVSRS